MRGFEAVVLGMLVGIMAGCPSGDFGVRPEVRDLADGGEGRDSITISFELRDRDGTVDSVRIEYSTDGGATWHGATIANPSAGSASGSVVSGLHPGEAWTAYEVTWDSWADGVAVDGPAAVTVRLTPWDSDGEGDPVEATAIIDNNVPPTITAQPVDETIVEGEVAAFAVSAAGPGPLSYQWRRDGADIAGSISSSYTTPAATMADDGALFSCVVTNAAGSVTSNAAAMTVNVAPPTITVHPSDLIVVEGDTAAFSVTAAGSGTLTYQWERNGTDIAGATSPDYTIPTTTLADDGAQFTCVVTNAGGSVESNPAALTVNMAPPTITVHPSDLTVVEGDTAAFSVTAAGSGTLTYQWERNGADIAGATSFSYTTPATVLGDSGARFTCVVTNAAGSVESNAARLWLQPVASETYMIVDLSTGDVSYSASIADLLTNNAYKTTSLVLKAVPAGTFQMGDQVGGHSANELPVHTVNITQPFYIGVLEVTQRQWFEINGDWPSFHTTTPDTRPVEDVSWNDINGASGFTNTLSSLASMTFRLPSEAEWEYACKAGTSTNYSYGDTENGAWMWYAANSGSQTHEVATTTNKPNPWGLYDMHGNVWEWCEDWSSDTYYQYCVDNSIADDPQGPASGGYRVLRGGAWHRIGNLCRSAIRSRFVPTGRDHSIGFRVAAAVAWPPPTINTHPSDRTVDEGQTATFSVTAAGAGTLTYQWQRSDDGGSSWGDILSAIGTDYTTPATYVHEDGALFRCVVTNEGGSTVTNAATLAVNNPPGLVGHWRFDETSGTTAADSSGNNYNGTLAGGPTWQPTGGKRDGALRFDGGNDYVDMGSPAGVNITKNLTLAAWIRPDDLVGDQAILGKVKDAFEKQYQLICRGATLGFDYETSGNNYAVQGGSLTADWHHVAVSVDGSLYIKMYVDGALVSSGTAPLESHPGSSGDRDLVVGKLGGTYNSTFFDGLIDDVRIYNRALSAAEVYHLAGGIDSGLVARWKFDDGTGSMTAADSSGNENHGTLTNMDPATDWVAGKIGGALDFDGIDDHVSFASSEMPTTTIAVWVNMRGTGTSGAPRIVRMPAYYLLFLHTEDHLNFVADRDAGGYGAWQVDLALIGTGWHHLAVSYDSTSLANDATMYVDGSPAASVEIHAPAGNMVSNTGTAEIGNAGSGRPFDGLLDDVRVYNRVLSAAEIQALYDAAP